MRLAPCSTTHALIFFLQPEPPRMRDQQPAAAQPLPEPSTDPTSPSAPFRGDPSVGEASRQSFPASDAPAWTPLAGAGTAAKPVDLAAIIADDDATPLQRARARAESLFGALEARDADGVLALLSDDVTLRIAQHPALVGQVAVREWLDTHLADLKRLAHSITDVRGDEDAIIAEAEVSVVRSDGRSATVPAALSLRLRGDRITRAQWYGDPRLWE
jgi:ketosteroid isomerase-like protein